MFVLIEWTQKLLLRYFQLQTHMACFDIVEQPSILHVNGI